MLNTPLVALPIWNLQLLTPKPIRGYPLEEDISLGAALKRQRLKKEWTQEQTAKHLQFLHPNYMRFERNIHIPDIKKKKRINDFLQFDFWDNGTNTLSNRLLLYRIENKLTAVECGALIGVSRNKIKRVELEIKVSIKMI